MWRDRGAVCEAGGRECGGAVAHEGWNFRLLTFIPSLSVTTGMVRGVVDERGEADACEKGVGEARLRWD